MTSVRLTLDEHADDLLSQDPFALLLGMLLDQQMPMERAFLGPAKLAERLGQNPLEPRAIATWDPDDFADDLRPPPPSTATRGRWPPGSRRWPVPWSSTTTATPRALWTTATTGEEVRARLEALPGFGPAKAAIFTALLGKQLGVRPPGGRRPARRTARTGRSGRWPTWWTTSRCSKVRETKQAAKAAARQGR